MPDAEAGSMRALLGMGVPSPGTPAHALPPDSRPPTTTACRASVL